MGSDPFRLDGSVALVTGAARGIGKVIAASLIQAGAEVASSDMLAYDEWEDCRDAQGSASEARS